MNWVHTSLQVDDLEGLAVSDHQTVLTATGYVLAIGGELHQVLGLLESIRKVHLYLLYLFEFVRPLKFLNNAHLFH